MPVKTLKTFLDQQKVRYISTKHSPAFTAQEVAHAVHASGKLVAKTVILELDGKFAMTVMPANYRIRWDRFMRAMGTDFIELADEADFERCFPDCEVGAMPPFGNLFHMQVYLCESLCANQEILFPAGSHSEIIRMATDDYLRLVKPMILSDGFVNPNLASPALRNRHGREPIYAEEPRNRRVG